MTTLATLRQKHTLRPRRVNEVPENRVRVLKTVWRASNHALPPETVGLGGTLTTGITTLIFTPNAYGNYDWTGL
jgi:hypothetical protein